MIPTVAGTMRRQYGGRKFPLSGSIHVQAAAFAVPFSGPRLI
jgi:hypothetical protein